MYKTFVALLAVSSSLAMASQTQYADVLFTHMMPTAQLAPWQRLDLTTPKYPVALAQFGIRGCAVFKVRVNAQGRADEVELVSAVPSKGLHRPAIKLLKSWQWQPNPHVAAAAVDVATSRQPMLVRLDFCMGGQSLAEAAANCQQQAQYACQQ